MHWGIFSYWTASSRIAIKALLKEVLLITCFYCFSTCCFNFSKISSAVVDANSFTTFSRDLPPWTKSKKCCQDDSPESAGLGRVLSAARWPQPSWRSLSYSAFSCQFCIPGLTDECILRSTLLQMLTILQGFYLRISISLIKTGIQISKRIESRCRILCF